MRRFLLLLGTLLVIAVQGDSPVGAAATEGQGAGKPGVVGPVPFTTVLESANSGLSEPTARVVHDQATFRRLWDEMQSARMSKSEPPEIDFARESVVMVALGARPSGGYRIRVEDIQERAGAIEVTVGMHAPGWNCVTARAITHPVFVARIARTTKEVIFRDQVVIHDCQ